MKMIAQIKDYKTQYNSNEYAKYYKVWIYCLAQEKGRQVEYTKAFEVSENDIKTKTPNALTKPYTKLVIADMKKLNITLDEDEPYFTASLDVYNVDDEHIETYVVTEWEL